MWQAVESSLQTFNKSRRRNTTVKSGTKNSAAANPVARPTTSIAELTKKTRFSKEEIRHLYRKFKQDSPSGQISKENFASIFTTLFPTAECYQYSIFLFRNIDRSNKNIIRFEDLVTTFSLLIHGSVEERLSWVFDLYDLDKDGILTRTELFQVVAAIFQLIVPFSKLNHAALTNTIEQRTDELVHAWDIRGKGVVHKEDFIQYCLKNESILRSMETLRSDVL